MINCENASIDVDKRPKAQCKGCRSELKRHNTGLYCLDCSHDNEDITGLKARIAVILDRIENRRLHVAQNQKGIKWKGAVAENQQAIDEIENIPAIKERLADGRRQDAKKGNI